MARTVGVLYGFENAKEMFRPAQYELLYEGDVTVWYLKYLAAKMMDEDSSITECWYVDQRHGLALEYHLTMKRNNVESFVMFKDAITRSGLRIK